MTAAQEKLVKYATEKERGRGAGKQRINGKLEEVFKAEDARIQSVVKRITETIDIEEPEEVKEVSKEGETNPPHETEVFAPLRRFT